MNMYDTQDPKQTFFQAVEDNDVQKVQAALNQDIALDTENEIGQTALLVAASQGHTDLVKLLLEQGADVHACDDGGDSPLIKAMLLRSQEIITLLLEHGAEINVNKLDKDGETLLTRAAWRGSLDKVKLCAVEYFI